MKIGKNTDEAIPETWIGFAYASEANVESVETWAGRFPFAEAIGNLSATGTSTEQSQRRLLTKEEK